MPVDILNETTWEIYILYMTKYCWEIQENLNKSRDVLTDWKTQNYKKFPHIDL